MADTTNNEPHPQVQRGKSKQPGVSIQTLAFVGDYDTLANLVDMNHVGRLPNTQSHTISLPTDEYIANMDLSGMRGGRGHLLITLTKQEETEVWGVEMAEIQKPIRTWHAGKENGPDLELLANWENQKSNQSLNADYNSYTYNGTSLQGDTLDLAKMIREEGIEYYVVYTPIITCTTRHNTIPSGIGSNNGKVVDPTSGEGVDISKLTGIADEWLKTGDRLTGAIDGTYTRVQQWTGADHWNEKLYEKPTADNDTSGNA